MQSKPIARLRPLYDLQPPSKVVKRVQLSPVSDGGTGSKVKPRTAVDISQSELEARPADLASSHAQDRVDASSRTEVSDKGDARTAIVVCGMHRSGTSALTRVVSLLGAQLPRHLYPAGLGNETGHWEPEPAVRLNDDMLRSAGTDVNALWDSNTDWLASPLVRSFIRKCKQVIEDEYGDEPLFVLKDPRISLFMPVWSAALDELEIAHHTIICFRNPTEVAQSLATRQTSVFPYEAWDLDRGGLLWLRYLLAAERHSRCGSRTFCDYAQLLNDWRGTMQRLGNAFGLAWPRWSPAVENEIDGFLRPELQHQRAISDGSRGGPWQDLIQPLHEVLLTEIEPQPHLFDSIARDYCRAIQIFGRHLAELNMKNAALGMAAAERGIVETAVQTERDAAIARAEVAEHRASAYEADSADRLGERDRALAARDEAIGRMESLHQALLAAQSTTQTAQDARDAALQEAEDARYELANIREQRDQARAALRCRGQERIARACQAGRERDAAVKAKEQTAVDAAMWAADAAFWRDRAEILAAAARQWEERHDALRARLIVLLRRCGIVFLAGWLPARLRRSAAAVVFGFTTR